MGYCFFHLQKIKSADKLINMFLQNYRMVKVPDADEFLKHHNEELYSSINGKTYYQAFSERLAYLHEREFGRVILPKNGVVAFDIITSLSRSDLDHVDLDRWKADQVKWLRNTFNRNTEKNGENVLSVVFHGDEPGFVHCHAVVLPIDNTGKFKTSEFATDKFTLQRMQSDYGRAMSVHGLQRGIQGSVASYEKNKKFYDEKNQNLGIEDMPIIKEGECREDYEERLRDFIINVKAGYFKQLKDRERILDEVRTEKKRLEKERRDLLYISNVYENIWNRLNAE